jgi:TPR repeat protein
MPTMRHSAKLLRATLTVSMVVLAMARAAVAGPFEDGVAAYQRRDYQTTYRLWRPLAEKGEAWAQIYLGYMYEHGQGAPESLSEALYWYGKASERGLGVIGGDRSGCLGLCLLCLLIALRSRPTTVRR